MKVTIKCYVMFTIAISLTALCGCGTFPMRREVMSPGIECAVFKTYTGPTLSADKISTITSTSTSSVQVTKIDSRSVVAPLWPISMDGWEEMRLEVLPGSHLIHVDLGGASISCELIAEAGHAYYIKTSTKNDPFLYIEDATSGKIMPILGSKGRKGFENAVEDSMASGELSSDEISVTYPDGSRKTIKKPNP